MNAVRRSFWLETLSFAAVSAALVLTLVEVVWMVAFVLALLAVALGFAGIAAGGKARSGGLGIVIGRVLATAGYVAYMNWI